ncbi:DUF1758 domain-containing protein [Trichonephila clavipes]|nr:DUF1758 domain-containing protein [Trichonephila clavipes]
MRECQARGSRLLPLEESSWIKWAPPGKEDEVNCKDIFANHLIVENEEFDFDRVRNLWLLETIGISPDNEVSLSDKEILKSFEQNTVHRSKRYETRLLWKEDSRKLKSNYEIAKRSLFGLVNIQGASLEIEIVEEDRQFLNFLWIKKGEPNLNLSTHNVETFRCTLVTFGVKCSPFLLAAVIRLHVEKYINKYKEACEMLNELHVDDLINSTSDTTEALQLSEEMIHILGEAGMNFTRWATNSTTLHEAWKLANIDCREISQESGVPLKTLGKFWDKANHYLKFDIKQFEKLNNLVKETKRVILSARGILFDPIGVMKPFTIGMKLLLL